MRTVNLILEALANSNDRGAGKRAMAFLDRIQQLHERQELDGDRDVVTYSLVLKCISNSDFVGLAEDAEKLLDEMEERVSNGQRNVAPNGTTYSIVIKIYGLCGKPDRAEAILERQYAAFQVRCGMIRCFGL